MNRRFKGSLVHADRFEKPLCHMWVELWDGGLFGLFSRKLAGMYTDASGRFDFSCHVSATASPLLRVYDEPWIPRGTAKRKRIFSYDAVKGLTDVDLFDYGKVRVSHWEYEAEWRFPTPRVDDHGRPPQDFAPGFRWRVLWTAVPLVVARALVSLLARFGRASVGLVQRLYPSNRTLRQEKEHKGSTRSEAWFGDRILNGFNPALPLRTDRENVYVVGYDWSAFESDGMHDLLRVEARFELGPRGLMPIEIDVERREKGLTSARAPSTPKETFTRDSPRFGEAMRAFRCAWAAAGEVETHLCRAHLNVGQYACAAFRNFRRNPVRLLLFPHLQEVVAINQAGSSAIFGPKGVLSKNTALTTNACWRRLLWSLGQCDWQGWSPRQPLFGDHRYAKAANLFWDVVTKYVDDFFESHRAGILDSWDEVHAFSFDLVEHAVEHVPHPEVEPYDSSEIARTPRRARQDGSQGALSPITDRESEPTETAIGNIKQVCRYAIFHATFFHSWTNDGQVDDAGEVVYASFGLRNGSLGDERDDRIAPLPLEASEQLFFVNLLSRMVRGLILKNDLRDMRPELIALLAEREPDFHAIDFDPAKIRSRINI
jgi:hypothetical protein